MSLSAELITPAIPNDDTVCDAARVSFDKRADQYTKEENAKLRRYLFKPRENPEVPHWAPFAMPRICLNLAIPNYLLTHLLLNANLAGFSWRVKTFVHDSTVLRMNGSLWAWYENIGYFPMAVQDGIKEIIKEQFPDCFGLFGWALSPIGPCPSVYPIEGICGNTIYESLRVSAPIFVCRQLGKHQQHLVWSEVSRRYVSAVPELFWPERWHKAPENAKQGASKKEFRYNGLLESAIHVSEAAVAYYNMLVDQKLAPEEARMMLPQNMMTSWIWTGSLRAYQRIMKERLADNVQGATREVAELMNQELIKKHGSNWRNL